MLVVFDGFEELWLSDVVSRYGFECFVVLILFSPNKVLYRTHRIHIWTIETVHSAKDTEELLFIKLFSSDKLLSFNLSIEWSSI